MSDSLRAILRNHMKEKLARDEVVASMTVRFARSIEIAQIAKTAGFDTLYVDMEHNTLTVGRDLPDLHRGAADRHHAAGAGAGQHAGLYLPGAGWRRDGGDHAARPLGRRGAGDGATGEVPAAWAAGPPAARCRSINIAAFPITETNAAMNDATSLVLMLETAAALENVEEIIAVDGVDMMMIGSNDLCGELGISGQYDHPKLEAAFERAIAAARKVGKHIGVGGLAARNDLMTKFVQMGARYVSTGTDMAFLMSACVQKAKFVREIKV